MSMKNHRRRFKAPPGLRYSSDNYHNGYVPDPPGKRHTDRTGQSGYLDKSLHGWGRESIFADVRVGASIGNDFTNGHRGMAKAVRGAKKYVRTRIRQKEKMKLIQIMKSDDV